jgi:hypothetical protein
MAAYGIVAERALRASIDVDAVFAYAASGPPAAELPDVGKFCKGWSHRRGLQGWRRASAGARATQARIDTGIVRHARGRGYQDFGPLAAVRLPQRQAENGLPK